MKQSAELDRIQEEMRPGAITATGFLGSDRRKLGDILDADNAVVLRMGLTHAGIAARMRHLRDEGAKGLGLTTRVEGVFDVQVDAVRGKLACPFHHPGLYEKITTTVLNVRMDRSVTYTDLTIHLIEEHGFYGGEGSMFRCDPVELATILKCIPVP